MTPLVVELFNLGHYFDKILHLDPIWVYVVVGLLVFAEDAVFVGFAVPGETAAIIAGVASAIAHVNFPLAMGIVVIAAIVGDSVGYEVGKHVFGPKLLENRLLAKHRERIDSAQDVLRRRGGLAVFLGRFTAFFRAMMPALAGSARMPYRRFLAWNALGGIVWGVLWVSVGHLAGESYHAVESRIGKGLAIALVVIVVAVIVVWRVRRHRSEAHA